MKALVLAVFLLLPLSGCRSPALERLIEVQIAAVDADLAEWETLTDEQQQRVLEEHARSWRVAGYLHHGRPLDGAWGDLPESTDH